MRDKLSNSDQFLKNPIVDLEEPHRDDRGEIIPLVDEDMQSAVLIRSKAGTVRANHYHKTDWHYCYVTKGKIAYYHRVHGSGEELKRDVIEAGQMFFTPSNVDHAMCFVEDTEFFCFGRNPRDQETYESDIERMELVRSTENGFSVVQ